MSRHRAIACTEQLEPRLRPLWDVRTQKHTNPMATRNPARLRNNSTLTGILSKEYPRGAEFGTKSNELFMNYTSEPMQLLCGPSVKEPTPSGFREAFSMSAKTSRLIPLLLLTAGHAWSRLARFWLARQADTVLRGFCRVSRSAHAVTDATGFAVCAISVNKRSACFSSCNVRSRIAAWSDRPSCVAQSRAVPYEAIS